VAARARPWVRTNLMGKMRQTRNGETETRLRDYIVTDVPDAASLNLTPISTSSHPLLSKVKVSLPP
jgi:hypothetical protein